MRRNPFIRPWTTLSLLLIGVSLLGLRLDAQAQSEAASPKETFQITTLRDASDASVTTLGAAELIRSQDDLWATIHVSDLEPGGPYTIWAVIFNEPSACTTDPEAEVRCGPADFMATPNPAQASSFYAGAFLTDDEGFANQSVHLRSGAPPDGTYILYGQGGINDNGVQPGLRAGNGFKAEVHLAIRSHGPILSDAIADQLSTFNGGCPPNTCGNVQIAVFPSMSEKAINE